MRTESQKSISQSQSKASSFKSKNNPRKKNNQQDSLTQRLITSDNNELDQASSGSSRPKDRSAQNDSQSQFGSKANSQYEAKSRMTSIKEYFGLQVQTTNRTISFNGAVQPINYQNNLVKNTKYNPLTFVPKVLYNQFKFFFNMFFLVTALSQLIELLRVGLFITYIGPLMLVLGLTMGKQGYDDYNTYKRDIQANSKEYEVVKDEDENGEHTTKTKSKDLKIGDIVILRKGDKVPADMLILYSDNEQGTLFLKTDQLDGQTDWKLRKAVKKTQSMIAASGQQNGVRSYASRAQSAANYSSLLDSQLKVEVKAPDSQIYNFSGVFIYNEVKERLTLENTMWTSTVLTNGTALGLVMYVGRQTRISMGSTAARSKVGILDMQLNWLSKVLFLLLMSMTIIFLLLEWTKPQYLLIQFMRMTILLSAIIPISMRVNLDFAKLFYAYGINKDRNIPGTIARNSTIPEQLGRVRYVLSDKTGTLTQNEMLFKRISIQDEMKFTDEHIPEMKEILKDYDQIGQRIHSKEKCLKEIVTSLALCHNVTPVYNQTRTQKEFQASSPDQITFVKIAEEFGLSILDRNQTSITLQLPSKRQVEYEILYSFPFKSETKRMGIVLRKRIKKEQKEQEDTKLKITHEEERQKGQNKNLNKEQDYNIHQQKQLSQQQQQQQIIFYLKGADAVMRQFVSNRQKRGFIDQECKDLSMTGLRTLVIAKKNLSPASFNSWSQRYEEQYNKMQPNQQAIEKLMDQLQAGVEFLGITGIEDKLQQDLKESIQSLKSANIKIWMITGDKVETAQCIGRSCGLQGVGQQNIKIESVISEREWKLQWQRVKQNLNRVLIIDGKTLNYVLSDQAHSRDFFLHAMQMPSVICCRCSPEQKRTLTTGVKKNKPKGEKSAVLGIGDGGNDVGMIQAADLGVGIVGKEGKQAALAADFSVDKFKYLTALLLWHGRLSYKRSALLASFIMHRGFILSVIQLVFSCVFFYLSIPAFNSYLSLGFTTFFTFWPVFSLILDTDINRKNAMKYPKLYDSLQSSNLLSTTTFLAWLWKASFQGAVIIFLSMWLFMQTSYLLIQTICFTVLILTEYCMTLSEINRIHMFTIVCVVGSLLTYGLFMWGLKDVIQVSSLKIRDFLVIGSIVAASWGPILAWKMVRKTVWPTDYEKVMKSVKRGLFDKKFFQNSVLEDKDYSGGVTGLLKRESGHEYDQYKSSRFYDHRLNSSSKSSSIRQLEMFRQQEEANDLGRRRGTFQSSSQQQQCDDFDRQNGDQQYNIHKAPGRFRKQ